MKVDRTLAILAVCAIVIVLLGAVTDIDMRLAHAMAGNGPVAFPLRDAWFADTFNHKYVKTLTILLGVCIVLPAAFDWWRPRAGWSARFRLRLRVVALSALIVPAVISLLKRISYSHCPWDLTEFGGAQAYVRLLEPVIGGVPYGHCMPAGHASSELWLVSLAVFWLPEHPRKAALAGGLLLLAGFGIGWIQQLRGAHFLTHTLWTMWISCALIVAIWRVATRKRAGLPQVQVS
jgi:membrane-associated PAP2 superfamily phosphatase